jgi:hypothetical protein
VQQKALLFDEREAWGFLIGAPVAAVTLTFLDDGLGFRPSVG